MLARKRREAFTLVEILIVVVILGILAAIVIPQFTSASDEAKGGNLVTQVQTLRSQIELYYAKNNEYPPSLAAGNWDSLLDPPDEQRAYLHAEPKNPFNGATAVANDAGEAVGWVWADKVLKASVHEEKAVDLPAGDVDTWK